MGFIRFTVSTVDEESLKPLGVLNAAFRLQREGKLTRSEDDALEELRCWFNSYLERPTKFSRSRSKAQHKKRKALSWFKDSAAEHIRQMRKVGAILKSHGIEFGMVTCERPGYILYEDEHQVVAESFSDTPT